MNQNNEMKMTAGLLGMSFLLVAANVLGQTNAEVTRPIVEAIPSKSPNILYAMICQVLNNPSSLLVVAFLCIVDWLVDDLPFIPSKYVVHCSVIAGASIFWMFTSRESVPSYFPHPLAVFVVNGSICGFVAFVIHRQAIVRLIGMFSVPKDEGRKEILPPDAKT